MRHIVITTSRAACILVFTLMLDNRSQAQQFSFNDPNIIFKDTAGNVLSSDAAMQLAMKMPFSIKQKEIGEGKTEVTIVPSASKSKSNNIEDEQWLKKWKGAHFPEFSLIGLNQSPISSEDFKGKILVINFWFTGCKPCLHEMPQLNRLVERFTNDEVSFIAPALDDNAKLDKLLGKAVFHYEIIPNAESLAKSMDVRYYPTHVVVDHSGKIVELFTGASANVYERLEAAISSLMVDK